MTKFQAYEIIRRAYGVSRRSTKTHVITFRSNSKTPPGDPSLELIGEVGSHYQRRQNTVRFHGEMELRPVGPAAPGCPRRVCLVTSVERVECRCRLTLQRCGNHRRKAKLRGRKHDIGVCRALTIHVWKGMKYLPSLGLKLSDV